ncbi:type III pantothenate kinase [Luteimonas terricola]|uniref:Type III pantothenate kinase n=1 Tax=Luteimonas terricola TaxID=645597 RepID=A0ABQ2E7V5_9GAMM|nr:type III pantothenate kinase [Luteimonas terricola]GGJ98272.1 type III pantothenate kinase [Luteimonas terricola]
MSDWLFDLGNTRLKLAPLEHDGTGPVSAFAHDGARFDPAWMAALPKDIDVAWIASVGPAALRASLLQALVPRAARVVEVRVEREMAGVRIGYAEPARLGIDRALALVGARARVSGWALVVGVGTALTVDLLDAAGLHHGGAIAPSPSLMREALHARAPQLPVDGGTAAAFGTDTADALAGGCLGAALGLIERSCKAAAALAGQPPVLLLHGGGAMQLLAQLDGAVHAPSLVMEGLARLAREPRGLEHTG